MSWTHKSSGAGDGYKGKHHFQHWYRDNQVYFITARCCEEFPASASEEAKAIFWAHFERCAADYGFRPWVTSLLDNHYHTVGYLERGENLSKMTHRLHGATAKLVNDLLEASRINPRRPRRVPFWHDRGPGGYFDGCLRDEKQGRLTYRYVCIQSQRHGVCADWCEYPHTRVNVSAEAAITDALSRGAFLEGVRYRRYMRGVED